MSKEQQEQLLEFVGNVVALLHEDGHIRECAEDAARSAVACLFGAVWDMRPEIYDSDATVAFVRGVIDAALLKFYGSATVGLQA